MDLVIKSDAPDLLPTRGSASAAGLDLRAKEDYVLKPRVRTMVGTGVYTKIPVGWVGLLVPRSGLSKRGITMTNSIGIIDADYRGEIMASLVYDTLAGAIANEQVIERGERIVQLVVLPCPTLSMLIWNGDSDWNDTDRGFGGFGSTGVK